jgi:hypothetical protein
VHWTARKQFSTSAKQLLNFSETVRNFTEGGFELLGSSFHLLRRGWPSSAVPFLAWSPLVSKLARCIPDPVEKNIPDPSETVANFPEEVQ